MDSLLITQRGKLYAYPAPPSDDLHRFDAGLEAIRLGVRVHNSPAHRGNRISARRGAIGRRAQIPGPELHWMAERAAWAATLQKLELSRVNHSGACRIVQEEPWKLRF